jgi:hypothetical protein
MNKASSNGNGLSGNGEHDDTAGLQSLLDSGEPNVYFPPPRDHYLISKPLVIHSGQTLRMDNLTRIRLAPKADAVMLTNDNPDGGNANISLIGGIWDMDNRAQSPNPLLDHCKPALYDPGRYIGVLMRLVNVRNLTIRGLTLRNPVTFGIVLARVENFTVEDITFDYPECNPIYLNMDGVHIHGPSRFGRIANLKGATHDDMVALNADDGPIAEVSSGPIEDVSIDGLYAENCFTGVRLLSMKSPIRRVRISNVFGSFRVNAVSISNFRMFDDYHPGGKSRFEDISLSGLCVRKTFGQSGGAEVDCSKVCVDDDKHALVWVESGVRVSSLSLTDFKRTEDEWSAPCLAIERGAEVDCLQMSHIYAVNHTSKPMHLLRNDGRIGQLNVFGTFLKDEAGQAGGKLLWDTGVIDHCCLQGIHSDGANGNPVYRRAALPPSIHQRTAEAVLDFPVGYKGFTFVAPAELVEDAQTDGGYALMVREQGRPFPVWFCSGDAFLPIERELTATYGWHSLGRLHFGFHGEEYLTFSEPSTDKTGAEVSPTAFCPRRAFISPSLQPGDYNVWILAASQQEENGRFTFRVARIVLARSQEGETTC